MNRNEIIDKDNYRYLEKNSKNTKDDILVS
jgi:hypothetical protein